MIGSVVLSRHVALVAFTVAVLLFLSFPAAAGDKNVYTPNGMQPADYNSANNKTPEELMAKFGGELEERPDGTQILKITGGGKKEYEHKDFDDYETTSSYVGTFYFKNGKLVAKSLDTVSTKVCKEESGACGIPVGTETWQEAEVLDKDAFAEGFPNYAMVSTSTPKGQGKTIRKTGNANPAAPGGGGGTPASPTGGAPLS